ARDKGRFTQEREITFNAGTHRQSLSSCFLLSVDDDLSEIYRTLTQTAMISKWSGGIGIHNFFAGYTSRAVAQLLICLLTCGLGGIVTSIWAIVEACTVTQDANGVRFK
ncbi:MAG: hypothetical protein RL515_582, partial [Verrucomicrobiota bacterium]